MSIHPKDVLSIKLAAPELVAPTQVRSDDAAHFALSVHPREGDALADAKGDTPGVAKGTETPNKPHSRGDAILKALGEAPDAATPAAPGVAAPTVGAVGEVPDSQIASPQIVNPKTFDLDQRILTQLVDSILVSAQEGKQEVRIKVQDAVLKDTHIVVRLQDGQLEVQLRTSDSYSSQVLYQNVDNLRHALEGQQFGQSLHVPVHVAVQVDDRHAGQQAARQQAEWQGAGHDACQGQREHGRHGEQGEQDGRSRGNFLWDRGGQMGS